MLPAMLAIIILSAALYTTLTSKDENEIKSHITSTLWTSKNGSTLTFSNNDVVEIFSAYGDTHITATYKIYVLKNLLSIRYIVDVTQGTDKRYAEYTLSLKSNTLTSENGFKYYRN